ncbi:hypothetical protein EV130_10567 [Rhizobium azibense]|uniref:Uncharacterized protein n=1 Tax=Rhizobium azibense TaxID=1136135 RepID=A0A4V2VBM0_9HYPH|nr:hypothetical protein EV130_10567 [Rhizobium azibense]
MLPADQYRQYSIKWTRLQIRPAVALPDREDHRLSTNESQLKSGGRPASLVDRYKLQPVELALAPSAVAGIAAGFGSSKSCAMNICVLVCPCSLEGVAAHGSPRRGLLREQYRRQDGIPSSASRGKVSLPNLGITGRHCLHASNAATGSHRQRPDERQRPAIADGPFFRSANWFTCRQRRSAGCACRLPRAELPRSHRKCGSLGRGRRPSRARRRRLRFRAAQKRNLRRSR